MTHAPRSDETVAALLRCSLPGTEHVVLETILKIMLEPPYLLSTSRWLFYAGIIVSICKASKDYPPTLAETFDVLFRGVAGLAPPPAAGAPASSIVAHHDYDPTLSEVAASGAQQISSRLRLLAVLMLMLIHTSTYTGGSSTHCRRSSNHLPPRPSPGITSAKISDPRRLLPTRPYMVDSCVVFGCTTSCPFSNLRVDVA